MGFERPICCEYTLLSAQEWQLCWATSAIYTKTQQPNEILHQTIKWRGVTLARMTSFAQSDVQIGQMKFISAKTELLLVTKCVHQVFVLSAATWIEPIDQQLTKNEQSNGQRLWSVRCIQIPCNSLAFWQLKKSNRLNKGAPGIDEIGWVNGYDFVPRTADLLMRSWSRGLQCGAQNHGAISEVAIAQVRTFVWQNSLRTQWISLRITKPRHVRISTVNSL